jgi:hypothetical protein
MFSESIIVPLLIASTAKGEADRALKAGLAQVAHCLLGGQGLRESRSDERDKHSTGEPDAR